MIIKVSVGGSEVHQMPRPETQPLAPEGMGALRGTNPKRPGSEGTIKVLEKAISMIDEVSSAHEGKALTEIANACAVPLSTAHRIMKILESHDIVARVGREKIYTLGDRWAAPDTQAQQRLKRIAYPIMLTLNERLAETILLTGLSRSRSSAICIARVESRYDLRLTIDVGTRLPLHIGSHQHAIAAFMSAEEIEDILSGPLVAYTKKTTTNPDKLRLKLAEVRRKGFSLVSDETTMGVTGLAVPILSPAGKAAYALGIAGPSERIRQMGNAEVLKEIRAAARSIAKRTGLQTPDGPTKGRHLT